MAKEKWSPLEIRNRGRPLKTWIGGIRNAMVQRNLKVDNWKDRKVRTRKTTLNFECLCATVSASDSSEAIYIVCACVCVCVCVCCLLYTSRCV